MHLVELRELEVFLALADELHFGRTAQRLGITQPRVSQTLRDLERKLGTPLVQRTSRRVALTPPGERLRAELQRVYSDLTDVIERATAQQLTGTIRIALMFPNVGGEELVRVIDTFEASNPGCNVEVTTTPPDDPGGPLRRGDVDLLVATVLRAPVGLIVVATLGTETRVLAVGTRHPLAQRSQVCIEDLADYMVAAVSILPDDHQEAWVPFHTPSGRPIERTARRPTTNEELAMLVARGKVVHPTVPSTVAFFGPPNVALVPIVDLPPLRVAALRMPGPMSPRLRAFIRIAADVTGTPQLLDADAGLERAGC